MSKCIRDIGGNFSLWYDTESFNYGVFFNGEPSTVAQLLSWPSLYLDNSFVNVDWLLTSACNLCCPYCIATDIKGDLSHSKLDLLLGEVIRLHPLHVTLSGGEPTLSPHLAYIIEHLPKDIACSIDTNGTHPDFITSLIPCLQMRSVNFRVTIDSISYDISEKTRPSRSKKRYLDSVFDTIKLLQSADIPVMVHTTVTSLNLNHLDAVACYLERTGIYKWKLYRVDVRRDEIRSWAVNIKDFLSQVRKLELDHPNICIDYDYEPMGESVIIITPDGLWLTENSSMSHRVLLFDSNSSMEPCWGRLNTHKHIKQYLK